MPSPVPLPASNAPAAMIAVFVPVAIFPEVRVRVRLIVGLLFNVMPLLLATVRLLSADTALGTLTNVALPPKERLDDDVVARLPDVTTELGPFRARLLPEIARFPLASVSVLPTVMVPDARIG